MILEHALLGIRAGEESAFEKSMRGALPVIESAEGCFGAEVRRQSEDGSVYLLLVRWSSIDAHLAFRETELFTKWRSLTHPYYQETPRVTHFHEPLAL
ncbi:MAG TPA: antibiotic biosynthesis monooxygenase family protein [Acidimicrobiales bacterium]|nr:antibiotic biosynthesis monooxygenase family protein [Acidimicrobiales bacterium]